MAGTNHPPGASIFTAAILAGGRGRRLGGVDKGALVVGGTAILDRQVTMLHGLTPHVLVIVSQKVGMQRADVPVVVDCIEGAGALGGIYTALTAAPTEQVLVIACDMPFLNAAFLAYLAECGRDVEAAVPHDQRGRHPLCASYQRGVASRLHERLARGDLRVLEALTDLQVRDIGPGELARYDPDGRLLSNINTPRDYVAAQERTAE